MERVADPGGAEWTVVRRWAPEFALPEWRGSADLEVPLPDADIADGGILGAIALMVLAVVLLTFIVAVAIPLLFFGGEVVVALAVAAAGLAGRLAFGHPWTIEARRNGVLVESRQATGWAGSRAAVEDLVSDIALGKVGVQPHMEGSSAPVARVRWRAVLALLLALLWGGGLTSLVALALVPGLRRDSSDRAVRVMSDVVVLLGVAGLVLSVLMLAGLAGQDFRAA